MVPVFNYGILGPLIVRRDETEIPVAGVRDRTVLARLLLSPGEAVSKDQLIDALYGDSPRKTASTQIHGAVKRLRYLLGTASIQTNTDGYLLVTAPGSVDAKVFEQLVAQARAALRAGRTDDAARDLRRALELWRGPALAGFDGEVFVTEAHRWEELRLAAVEENIEVQFELGRYTEVIPELHLLTAAHPMRERFAGQLMLALYRAQRTTEALRTYADLRNRLVNEMGVDPSPDLQHLYEQILRQDSALQQAPVAAFTPQQLPAGLPSMIGRDGELKQAVMALTPQQRRHLPVVVIVGNGGVGKTTVALEVAHLVTADYPDGQLFANLGGAGTRPARPHDVLGRFLRALVTPHGGPRGADLVRPGRDERLDRQVLVLRRFCGFRRSDKHDEHIFIRAVQACELTFFMTRLAARRAVSLVERDRAGCLFWMDQVGACAELLNAIFHALKTLTPELFLGFRDATGDASAVQSLNYHLMELVVYGYDDRKRETFARFDHLRVIGDPRLRKFRSLRDAAGASGDPEVAATYAALERRLLVWRGRHYGFGRTYLPNMKGSGGTEGAGYLKRFVEKDGLPSGPRLTDPEQLLSAFAFR